jgi:hypothetical protein
MRPSFVQKYLPVNQKDVFDDPQDLKEGPAHLHQSMAGKKGYTAWQRSLQLH